MPESEVDLEALAGAFHRREGLAGTRATLAAERARLRPGDRALDVGGGTGDHASVWARRGIRAVVVDPADGMVRRAAGRVWAVAGRGEAMPFRSKVFDLAYFHLSLQYCDWRAALAEAARVSRVVWVWTFGHDYLASSFLGRWFPSVVRHDLERFPSPAQIAGRLEELGLRVERGGPVVERRVWAAEEWEEAVRERFIGTLHLLERGEIEQGLEVFRRRHRGPVSYLLPYLWVGGYPA